MFLFPGSVASDDGKSQQDPSPDKTPNAKTPKERKRKRKNGDDAEAGGPGQAAKPGRKTSDNTRTINDYFGKPATSSPGRVHSGTKSPSPSTGGFLPCSPQPPFNPGMGEFRMQPPAPRQGQGVPVISRAMKAVQTDMTAEKVEELVTRSSAEQEEQEAKIEELSRRLQTSQKAVDTQKDTINKCLSVVKECELDIFLFKNFMV